MKKISKKITMYLGLFLCVQMLFFSIGVQAKTIPQKNFNVKFTTKDYNDLLKKYSILKSSVLEKKKTVMTQQIYINYIDDGSTVKKTEYTKDEYEKLPDSVKNVPDTINVLPINSNQLTTLTTNNVIISPQPRTNSWMRLTLSIDSNDNYNYDIYGYYEWITAPNYKEQDVFGISHGVGLTFSYGNSYSDICNPYGGIPGTTYPKYTEDWHHYTYYGTPSNFKGQVGGVATIFKLCYAQESGGYLDGSPTGTRQFPFGMIYAKATRSDSTTHSVEIVITYDHQQKLIEITPSINIPLGGSISITNTTSYDPFDLSYGLSMQ